MSVDVIMPQMGESIAEGTIVKWLKSVGDSVQRDEPLFEISTDKVDAEIPSPGEGVLSEILVEEGQTVEINTVVGRIGGDGAAASPQPSAKPAPTPEPAPAPAPPPAPAAAPAAASGGNGTVVRSSPVVQKIAAEHGVDLSLVPGTGAGGRITKKDVLAFIDSGKGAVGAPTPVSAPTAQSVPKPASAPAPTPPVTFADGDDVVREPMSIMRKKIAEHMRMSKDTSAHVYSVFEVDAHNMVKRRNAMKAEYAAQGVKLTYLPFFIEACVNGIREFPVINARIDGDDVVYHRSINVGIAVAIDKGLIVPVIKNAEQMNLLGIAKTANDLADRARTKRLVPEDVQGGTFTITNVGVWGSLHGMPIINQPQSAILGIGAIVKRPVVIDDAIAIRPIVHISMSYDHRLIDGSDASQFLAKVRAELEKPLE